jgi:VIT1/CCC1 family predicted Fe2+/Mn2+ transporter
VLLGGLAEAAAGALAMGAGVYLATQAENQLFTTEIADEEAELRDHPDIERDELEIRLCDEGLSPADARVAAERIARSPRALIRRRSRRSSVCRTAKSKRRLAMPSWSARPTPIGAAVII